MSRAELIQISKELNIDYRGLSILDLTIAIRKKADKRFNRKYKIGSSWVSDTLRKFLVEEYNYVLKDRKGNKTKIVEDIEC